MLARGRLLFYILIWRKQLRFNLINTSALYMPASLTPISDFSLAAWQSSCKKLKKKKNNESGKIPQKLYFFNIQLRHIFYLIDTTCSLFSNWVEPASQQYKHKNKWKFLHYQFSSQSVCINCHQYQLTGHCIALKWKTY